MDRFRLNTSIFQIVTLVTNVELNEKINQFFNFNEFTEEEKMCEQHFETTHYRNEKGKYVVSIPLKNGLETPDLGDSRRVARAALFSLERRFETKPELKKQYSDFIHEYIKNGHMREATNYRDDAYFMPHHCVFKESTTTKLRVVFNASQNTSNKKNLNQQLAQGPMDQTDLTSNLIRWRRHKIAFAADIEKMYRQILVNKNQTHLQRILWRESPTEPIKEYELTTVTYGTANAPYLAIRTLKQLSIDEALNYPKASKIIQTDFYVDDVLSGANSLEEAQSLYFELCL